LRIISGWHYPWQNSVTTMVHQRDPIIECVRLWIKRWAREFMLLDSAQGQPVQTIHIQELRDRVTRRGTLTSSGILAAYDGDSLRIKNTNGATTYYFVRAFWATSVAEINAIGGWNRGYVYRQ